jgi:hypothetical protein
MRHLQICFSPLFISLLVVSVSGLAQEGGVTVVAPGSRELKRTAHWLGMPPEQLKNARSALQEATDLVKQMDPMPQYDLNHLASLWLDINRPKAAAVLEGLIEKVRKLALMATDFEAYRDCADRAQSLLKPLAELDPDRGLLLARKWPAPPLSSGSAGEKVRSGMEAQVRDQLTRRLAYSDPERALELADESPTGTSAVYEARGQRIGIMSRQGRKEEALRLADQWTADFNESMADPVAVRDYLGFLREVAALDPNRFLAAIESTAGLFSSSDPPGSPLFWVGDQRIPINRAEFELLSVFRTRMQPELMLKTFDLLPELKAKAEQAGGIDKLLAGARVSLSRRVKCPPAVGAGTKATDAQSEYRPLDKESLLTELRGKAEKDPGLVRSRLAEVARDSQQVPDLIELADMARSNDLELASMALDVAKPLLSRVESLQDRASLYEQMAEAYRNCDGEADAGLLRDGFALVARMRDESDRATPGESGSQYMANDLEATLVSELARIDFGSAMPYVRSMPEKPLRLAVLLRVVQSLREWGYN